MGEKAKLRETERKRESVSEWQEKERERERLTHPRNSRINPPEVLPWRKSHQRSLSKMVMNPNILIHHYKNALLPKTNPRIRLKESESEIEEEKNNNKEENNKIKGTQDALTYDDLWIWIFCKMKCALDNIFYPPAHKLMNELSRNVRWIPRLNGLSVSRIWISLTFFLFFF